MTRGRPTPRPCLSCTRTRTIESRGLCGSCYRLHHLRGTHLDFPRTGMPLPDLLEERTHLQSVGLSDREIAERLGIKPESLERALLRARARGVAA